MLAKFFIDRPIFAWVLSIVITLIGGVAAFLLPIAQYPEVTPPTVQVTCNYPGANATVVADSVAAPIEQQVNGVEHMLYMSSQCTNDGAYNLTVTFELGTDLNMAQVLVQNRVALATPQLPTQVQVQGVSVKKKSPSILLAVNLISTNPALNDVFLSNYATIQIKDELLRINGVGDIAYLGQRDYSMRVWLNPEKMAALNLATTDVIRAVQNQNSQAAVGQIGQQPMMPGQLFQLTMSTLGRLEEVEQFGDIVIKTNAGTSEEKDLSKPVVRLRDVARVELGAQQYDQVCHLDGQPSVGLAVYQSPGSNALDVADRVKKKMEELRQNFPSGLQYKIVYDTTPFVEQSIEEVFKTLYEAVILVAIVVLFFLQDWKAMILPMIDVPVSLIGTFAFMTAFGFTLNNLTLFGLVLAIGIVVDDAIVVLEAIEHHISQGLDPRSATIKAMSEITGPIIAITLVLTAVFLPAAFVTGITGQFYRQFALTIAASMVISATNAMTLTPARAVTIFKTEGEGKEPTREALPWWIFAIIGGVISYKFIPQFLPPELSVSAAGAMKWLARAIAFAPGLIVGGLVGRIIIHPVNAFLSVIFRGFNNVFDRITQAYGWIVSKLLRVSAIVLIVYVGLVFLTGWTMSVAPTGFIPVQDQGYVLLNAQLPDSWSVQETQKVMAVVDKIALGDPKDRNRYPGIPGVAHVLAISGQSFLLNANGSNFGSAYVILDPFPERKEHDRYDAVIAEKLREQCAKEIPDAVTTVFRAPPIQGLGTAGGFKLELQQRGFVDLQGLQSDVDALVHSGNQDPRLVGLFTIYRADTPQVYLDIDRTKCESLGVDVQDAFNTLQVYMGGYFVNLFNKFGRTWQVNILADQSFRAQAEEIRNLKVRNKVGEMVPFGTITDAKDSGGPVMVTRYNMYAAAPINGNTAAGVSSGQAVDIMAKLANEQGASYEWTEITYMQILAGNTAMFVFALGAFLIFLILAAKYESWGLPMSVILVVPMCLLCAVVGMLFAKLPVDVFVQVGFLVLVGLAAKNAILIVEFAKGLQDSGTPSREATVQACKLRLRPIIMTAFAFILGVVPLVVAEGAGAEMRSSLGTAVFSGMIGVTAFGIFLTPVFYYVISRSKKAAPAEPAQQVAESGNHQPPVEPEPQVAQVQ
jgi:multidrug efflux pump